MSYPAGRRRRPLALTATGLTIIFVMAAVLWVFDSNVIVGLIAAAIVIGGFEITDRLTARS
jgi:hypothetical protein